MAFGFEATNNSGSVLLSDIYPTLVYSHRGQIIVENGSVVDRPAVGSVSFPSAIQQIVPPKIFIRFNSGRHNSCNVYLVMNGSPNNWTGFTMYAGAIGGGTLPRHVLDYVVCKLTDNIPPVSPYGMVIYDSTGKQTYKSEDRPVRYDRFTKSWSLSVTNAGGGIYFTNLNPVGITIVTDDYIELSPMNRGNAHFTADGNNTGMYTSTQLLSGGTRVLQLVMQNSSSLYTQLSEVGNTFFCMPICKFPTSQYP